MNLISIIITKLQFNRDGRHLTYADLYALAGAEAISCLSGPDIPWRYGRVDTMDVTAAPEDGLIPAPTEGTMTAT